MKLHKTAIWTAAVIALAAAGGIINSQTNQAQTVKVQKSVKKISNKTKYGFKRDFKFPQSWRGKLFSNTHGHLSNMIIKKNGFNTPWTGEYVELVSVGKVKGTNKYLWQMPHSWFTKHNKIFKNLGRVTTKNLKNKKWIVFSPIDENNIKIGYAFSLQNKKIDGKTQKVMFEANPKTGEIYDQFYRSPKLAQKYQNYHFKNETYAPVFNQYQKK